MKQLTVVFLILLETDKLAVLKERLLRFRGDRISLHKQKRPRIIEALNVVAGERYHLVLAAAFESSCGSEKQRFSQEYKHQNRTRNLLNSLLCAVELPIADF